MNKPDRRTERTRAALMSAFISVMLSEGYDAVTVERVAEAANVGRSTFYMHYTGKEDILRQSMTRPSTVLAVLVGNIPPPGVLVKQLLHFHDQRRRNYIFFEGQVRRIWVSCLAALIEPRLASLVRHTGARPVVPLPLAALQIAESQIALVANWLSVKPAVKVEPVADALTATTRAQVAALLGLGPDAPLVIPGERFAVREA
jgi:AcrR family transcriptional regulator